MFAAFLGIHEDAVGEDGPPRQPGPKRRVQKQHRNKPVELNAKLELGERALTYLHNQHGGARADAYVEALQAAAEARAEARAGARAEAPSQQMPQAPSQQPSGPQPEGAAGSLPTDASGAGRLPWGFWAAFTRDELKLKPCKAKQVECARALRLYIERQSAGAKTRSAMRGGRKGSSRRSDGAAHNATKALGLGFRLLQYFVDFVQMLRGRADSTLLMTRAREMRVELEEEGLAPSQLPKLEGSAGKSWFRRWRKGYGIIYKAVGMKLKVSWRKVLRRIRVELGNIFRFFFIFLCLRFPCYRVFFVEARYHTETASGYVRSGRWFTRECRCAGSA